MFWFAGAAGVLAWLAAWIDGTSRCRVLLDACSWRIVPVSSLGMAIGSIGLVSRALLSRRMNFRAVALADIAGAIAYGVTAISGALLGWGAWSIVAGGLALHLSHRRRLPASAWRPGVRTTWRGFRPLLGFGMKTVGVSMLNFVRANLDYLVIGRSMGAAPLGQYTMAYKIADFPAPGSPRSSQAVVFPASHLFVMGRGSGTSICVESSSSPARVRCLLALRCLRVNW